MASQINTDAWLSEINVTPFVDVLLVLLIIFMITAPVMTRSVGVNLPKEKLTKEETKQSVDVKTTAVIGINKSGYILYNKKEFDINLFFSKFNELVDSEKISKIYIQADKTVTYENLLKLMVFLKNRGHENIGLVFEEV